MHLAREQRLSPSQSIQIMNLKLFYSNINREKNILLPEPKGNYLLLDLKEKQYKWIADCDHWL